VAGWREVNCGSLRVCWKGLCNQHWSIMEAVAAIARQSIRSSVYKRIST